MHRRIVTIIEEECDGDCCSHAHTQNVNGAENRLPDPKGGQLDDKVLGAQGGAQESVNSPEKEGATERVVEQRADIVRTSPSSKVDVTIQPKEVSEPSEEVSRLLIKSWFATLAKSALAESAKHLAHWAFPVFLGWFKIVFDWLRVVLGFLGIWI